MGHTYNMTSFSLSLENEKCLFFMIVITTINVIVTLRLTRGVRHGRTNDYDFDVVWTAWVEREFSPISARGNRVGKILAFARNSGTSNCRVILSSRDLKLVILIVNSQEKTLPIVFGWKRVVPFAVARLLRRLASTIGKKPTKTIAEPTLLPFSLS